MVNGLQWPDQHPVEQDAIEHGAADRLMQCKPPGYPARRDPLTDMTAGMDQLPIASIVRLSRAQQALNSASWR